MTTADRQQVGCSLCMHTHSMTHSYRHILFAAGNNVGTGGVECHNW